MLDDPFLAHDVHIFPDYRPGQIQMLCNLSEGDMWIIHDLEQNVFSVRGQFMVFHDIQRIDETAVAVGRRTAVVCRGRSCYFFEHLPVL